MLVSRYRIIVNGIRPLAINKRTLVQVMGGSTKLVDRLLYSARYSPQQGWLQLARRGSPGVECLIDTASAENAYQRILHGEEPPRLPSEPTRLPSLISSTTSPSKSLSCQSRASAGEKIESGANQ